MNCVSCFIIQKLLYKLLTSLHLSSINVQAPATKLQASFQLFILQLEQLILKGNLIDWFWTLITNVAATSWFSLHLSHWFSNGLVLIKTVPYIITIYASLDILLSILVYACCSLQTVLALVQLLMLEMFMNYSETTEYSFIHKWFTSTSMLMQL